MLEKNIGLLDGITLIIGTTLGTGILILPELTYQFAGQYSIFSWIADTLIAIPLILIFIDLASKNPSAGGVAEFIRQGFSSLYGGSAFVLLGAFITGLPAVAITGAEYVNSVTPYPDFHTPVAYSITALLFFSCIFLLTSRSTKNTRMFQNIIVPLLCLGLAILISKTLLHYGKTLHTPTSHAPWMHIWHGMGLAFFAYTGWETVASTSAEFKNPKRDFPKATIISFIVIACLYLGLAAAVSVLPVQDALTHHAPLEALMLNVINSHYTIYPSAFIILLIIFSNLNGTFWGGSRLIFDIAEQGHFPKWLKLQHINKNHIPKNALRALWAICFIMMIVYALRWVSLGTLIKVAGQCCAILYGLCILAYYKITPSFLKRTLSVAAFLACLFLLGSFSWLLLIALALFLLPYAFKLRLSRTVGACK